MRKLGAQTARRKSLILWSRGLGVGFPAVGEAPAFLALLEHTSRAAKGLTFTLIFLDSAEALMEARVENWFPTQTLIVDAAQLLPAARDMFARTDFPSLHGKPDYRNGFTTYHDNPFARFVQHPSGRDFFSVFESAANVFGQSQGIDLNTHSACVTAVWISRINKGGSHLRHVHGDAHMCGAMYVDAPSGASPIRFHSPVTTVMRFCPLPTAVANNKATAEYVDYEPTPGRLLLWDGWLEHEVPLNPVDGNRDCISFNIVFKEKNNNQSSRRQDYPR